MTENPYVLAGVIILALVGIGAIWSAWMVFCAKISNHAWWGFALFISPLVIFGYLSLVMVLS